MRASKLFAFRELGALVLLLVVVIGAFLKEPRFLQSTSLESMLLWVPLLATIGIGQMAVIVTRGIDVSVGSMVGLAAMAVGMLFKAHTGLPLVVGIAAGAVVGLILGSINGGLVAFARVPPIIATLGTLSAYRGFIFILSQGHQVDSNYVPESLTNLSLKGPITIGGVTVPWIFVVSIVLGIAAAWVLAKTRSGRDVFAIGSNPEAARLRGIPVKRTLFLVYACTGALCGLAGSLYISRYGFVNPATAGLGLELVVIAAVVIGGTNIAGGTGSILGVFLGCFLLASINQALAVLGIEENWQQLVYGGVILIGVLFDAAVKRKLSWGSAT